MLRLGSLLRPNLNLLDIAAPSLCVLCGLKSKRPLTLCRSCESEIPSNLPACSRCAVPLIATSVECGQCLQHPPAFTSTLAPRLYAEPISGLIKRFKFQGDLSLLSVLTELMVPGVSVRLEQGPTPDALVPMPLHWFRRWRRGFNQAELLANSLARHPLLVDARLRVDPRLCYRKKATRPQHGLDARSRRHNLRNAMGIRSAVNGLRLAVVDDVMTTGTSADCLAKALLNAGAQEVEVWCCARTPGPQAVSAKRS